MVYFYLTLLCCVFFLCIQLICADYTWHYWHWLLCITSLLPCLNLSSTMFACVYMIHMSCTWCRIYVCMLFMWSRLHLATWYTDRFATHQLPMSSFSSLPTVSASVGGMANSATTTDSTNGVGISSLQNNPQQTYQNGTMTTGPIPALSSYPGVLQGMNSMAPGLSYQARPQPLL